MQPGQALVRGNVDWIGASEGKRAGKTDMKGDNREAIEWFKT